MEQTTEEYLRQQAQESLKYFRDSKESRVCSHAMTTPDPDDDQVNNPSHYQSVDRDLELQGIDAITCMRAAFGTDTVKDFCICNALKYIYRHSSKGGNTDIQKAIWYLNKYLELGGYE